MKRGKKKVSIVGTRCSLRVVLYGKDRFSFDTHARYSVVIQIVLCDHSTMRFQIFFARGKAMILRSDGDFFGLNIFYGLVTSTMTKLQLIGACPNGMG